MKLGPIQTKWIEYLEAHPEQQHLGSLGFKKDDKIKLCCLGAGTMCISEGNFDEESGMLNVNDSHSILSNYKKLGLYSNIGSFQGIELAGYSALAYANDNGISWKEIAKFMRDHPEVVFAYSV